MFHKLKDKKTHSMTTRTPSDTFYLPKANLTLYRKSFAYSSAKIYNNLDVHIKQAVSLFTFKSLYLKNVLK